MQKYPAPFDMLVHTIKEIDYSVYSVHYICVDVPIAIDPQTVEKLIKSGLSLHLYLVI